MTIFDGRDISDAREHQGIVLAAVDHALRGGQALHVWSPPTDAVGRVVWPGAPRAFVRGRGPWAHLFDQDVERLRTTAKRLGVRVIVIDQRSSSNQHVDLCGQPLRRAMEEADHGGSAGHQRTDCLFTDPQT